MNEELFKLEERFQPFLLRNDYTFVGPIDENLMKIFNKAANRIAPRVALLRSVHHVLSNRNATKNALLLLPQDTQLRIFVVLSNGKRNLFLHSTLEEYCRRNNINFDS